MASLDTLTLPLDPTSAADLAASGLEYERVNADGEGFRPFQRARPVSICTSEAHAAGEKPQRP